jgi:citrate lyase subunit beta/citryl-CoA lyase
VVPKVASVADVAAIEARLEAAGAGDHTRVWAMVETPAAMLHAEEIAACSERLTVLVMGTNDLAKELHAEHVPGRQPLLAGLGLCLLAARATGKVILDGVFNDIGDPDGFEAECVQGREMGFDGKTLIHPSQLEPANRVWAPAPDAVDDARALIATFDEGVAAGKGVVTHGGRMIENMHVENARRLIALADAIAALDAG